MDGSQACPFVAFDDERDARSDRPDRRHRCFAEPEPAPRALAHQEAYCLSSAFPVCPTFQAWARREAAHARTTGEAPASPPRTGDVAPAEDGDADPGVDREADDAAADDRGADLPIETRPRRNPPRDWAAPPPWATGAGAGGQPSAGSGTGRAEDAPGFRPARTSEGQGLVGSAADLLASGASLGSSGLPVDAAGPADRPDRRPADLPSAGPDPELAGLVSGAGGSRPGARGAALSDEERAAAGYPLPTRTGRRPAVSATRADRDRDRDRERQRAPHLEHVQHDGPAWERARRAEAYPTIKSRASFGGMPGLPPVLLLAAAIGIAALALFFLPALLGIGGGETGSSPSPSPTVVAPTATPEPTPKPAPTPQVYVIKEGDTLSRIAKRFGLTLDQLLAANKDTIKDPDLIAVGDQIIIPLPVPDEVSGASPKASTAP